MDQPRSDSPIHWSAGEIASQIVQRQISAVEVVRAFVARIEAVNPQLNAVVVQRFDEALQEAAAADERQARGDVLGPLHGVPVTLKECFHLAGTVSTIGLGSAERRRLIEHDGILVQRLRRAGAIILGKTNVPQLMIWHETDNPVYGRTNNPWDLSRTPGGSTGGEAAIIAARGSPLGLGNDLGGSIRVPCHYCGICGIKPTAYRLPRGGTMRTLRGFEAIVTQAGPMARRVSDLWLALNVLSDEDDGYVRGDVASARIRDPAGVAMDKLRVLAWTDDGVFPPSPAIARAVREAIATLRERGAEIVELDSAEVKRSLHTTQAFDLYLSLLGADGGADARRIARGSPRDWRVARLLWVAGLGPGRRAAVLAGLRLSGQNYLARLVNHARPRSANRYWQLIERKNMLAAAVIEYLTELRIDALLCPPHALPAPPHVRAFDLLAASSYAFFMNLLGLPAGVVPVTRVRAGEDSSRPNSRDRVLQQAQATDAGSVGLPVGVQIAALPWREDVVLAAMNFLEKSVAEKDCHFGTYVVPRE